MTGRSVGSDASPLSCFSSPQAPYRSFPPKAAKTHSFRCVSSSHRTRFAGLRREPCFPPITAQTAEATSHTAWESPLQRGSKSHSHKRRNVRFEGLRRAHTPPQPLTAHTAAYTAKQGCFGWGRYHYPRTVLRGSEPLRGRDLKRQTLPLLGLGQGAPGERREPAEQRCAHARRCSEASRPRWAA